MALQTLVNRVLTGRTLRYALALFVFIGSLVAFQLSKIDHTSAAPSSYINFQARLKQSSGAIVSDGYYNVQFKLYNASSGGSALWTETYYDSNGAAAGNDNRVRVVNGYLTVSLGSQTAFPALSWDQEMWITMNIGGTSQVSSPSWDGEMNPRLRLTAVPYAFQAASASQLQKTAGANTGTLSFNTLTGNRTVYAPDESGTICLQGSANCSFAPTSGSANYIQNGTSPQTASYNITGNGTIGGNLTVAGSISSPGVNIGSEKFGAGAVADGVNSTAIGNGADAGYNSGATAIGQGTIALQYNATAIGQGASADYYATAIGQGASAGGSATALGQGAEASGTYSVALGIDATASGSYALALGRGASAAGPYAIALGRGASVSGSNSIALGTYTNVNGSNSITLGDYSSANYNSSIALGYGASTTAANQLVIGSYNEIKDVYIGNGVVNSSPIGFTLQATGGDGTNVVGASTTIAGGRGTGSANGGDIIFSTSTAGASGTTLNALSEKARITAAGRLQLATQGSSGGIQFGGDVQLFRGAANRLDLASGDSLNIVSGNLQFGGTTVITSARVLQNVTANASIITAGTLNDARLSTNVALLNRTGQVFTGTNTIRLDSATAFQVQNALSANIFTVDTANKRVSLESNNFLTFDGGAGNAAARYHSSGNSLQIANYNTGGDIQLQSSAFKVVSAVDFATNLQINGTGQATFKNSSNSTAAFQVQNASGASLLGVNTTDSIVQIGGTGTNYAGGRLTFGDYQSGSHENVWVGEYTGDSDILQLQGKLGAVISDGATSQNIIAIFYTDTPSSAATMLLGETAANSQILLQRAGVDKWEIGVDGGTKCGYGLPDMFYLYTHAGGCAMSMSYDGETTFVSDTSTIAFRVQNTASATILGIDSLNNQVILGDDGEIDGKLTFENAINSNTITIKSSAPTASYMLTLPNAVGLANQCIRLADGSGTLEFADCGAGGASTLQDAYNASIAASPSTAATITTSNASTGILFKAGASANSTSLFQVQDAAANTVFNVDTVNSRIGVGTNAPTQAIHVTKSGDAAIRLEVRDVPTSTQYDESDDLLAGAGISDSSNGGTMSWSNPSNVTANDTASAVATAPVYGGVPQFGTPGTTHYLTVDDYGFSVPTSATITGIEIEVERCALNADGQYPSIYDEEVYILKNGLPTSLNAAWYYGAPWGVSTSCGSGDFETVSYGGLGELWEETWSAADINDPEFGASLSATLAPLGGYAFSYAASMYVDSVRAIVYYSYEENGTTINNYTIGGDQTDGKFKISSSEALGTADLLTLGSNGDVLFKSSSGTDLLSVDSTTMATAVKGLTVNITSSGNQFAVQASGVTTMSVNNTGQALFKNSTNSTTAFRIQNTSGQTLLGIDTANNRIFSTIPNGASAVGFTLNTPSYTTNGAKLLSVQNNAAEKFSIDKNGHVKFTSGTPTISSGGGAYGCSLTAGSNDVRGQIYLSTPGYTTAYCVLTFANPFQATPFTVLSAVNNTAGGAQWAYSVSSYSVSTTQLVVYGPYNAGDQGIYINYWNPE